MNVLGKILVFVNLVFSLLTAGLIVMVYTTRTNWNAAYTAQVNANKALTARSQADVAAAQEDAKAKEAQAQALTRERDRVATDRDAGKVQLAQAQAQIEQIKLTQSGSQTNNQALTGEIERRKAEVENLQKLVAERDKKISDIDKQMATLRDQAVQFRIRWEQAQARNEEFRQQNEALTREVDALRRQLGGGAAPSPAGQAITRSPEDLRGTIQRIEGDLATITPGGDAGVVRDQELQVYRTTPRPEYLGTIKIVAVLPHEAVGRLQGPKRFQVKKGDEVAANLGGGR